MHPDLLLFLAALLLLGFAFTAAGLWFILHELRRLKVEVSAVYTATPMPLGIARFLAKNGDVIFATEGRHYVEGQLLKDGVGYNLAPKTSVRRMGKDGRVAQKKRPTQTR